MGAKTGATLEGIDVWVRIHGEGFDDYENGGLACWIYYQSCGSKWDWWFLSLQSSDTNNFLLFGDCRRSNTGG